MKYIADVSAGYYFGQDGVPARGPNEREYDLQPHHIDKLLKKVWEYEGTIRRMEKRAGELERLVSSLREQLVIPVVKTNLASEYDHNIKKRGGHGD